MNSFISGGIKAVLSSSLVLTLALAGGGPASAAPQSVSYTCIAEVSTGLSPAIAGQSGGNVLWSGTVTGFNVAQATAMCHLKAHQAFAGNAAWSSPAAFCARYAQPAYEMFLGNTLKTRLVWLTDYLQELGHANGYNRIGGFSVVCDGPANLQLVPTTPTLVPDKL